MQLNEFVNRGYVPGSFAGAAILIQYIPNHVSPLQRVDGLESVVITDRDGFVVVKCIKEVSSAFFTISIYIFYLPTLSFILIHLLIIYCIHFSVYM